MASRRGGPGAPVGRVGRRLHGGAAVRPSAAAATVPDCASEVTRDVIPAVGPSESSLSRPGHGHGAIDLANLLRGRRLLANGHREPRRGVML